MQRSFLVNLILLLLVNLLIKPFFILGIDAEIQNRVGLEIYGDYFGLINFTFLLNILLDLGITNYNTRNIARNNEVIHQHFSGLVIIRAGLAVVYMVIAGIIALILGYDSMEMWILLILAFNQILASYILYFRSNLTGLHLFRQDRIISVLDRILLIVMMSWLLWGPASDDSFDIMWFVYGQTVAYTITAIISFIMVLGKARKFKFSVDTAFVKNILSESYPYALLILMTMIYHRTDGVMLERMLEKGDEEAGVYARGYRFFEASNMIAYLFAVVLLPIFSGMIKKGEAVYPLVKLSSRMILSGSVLLALTCFFFDTEILGLRYEDNLTAAAPVFGLLMLGFIAVSLNYVYGTLLTANGSLRILNIVALAGMVFNVVLNFILIPKFGAYGSAIASVVTLFLACIAQITACYRTFQFKIEGSLLMRFTVFIIGLFIIHHFGTILFESESLEIVSFIGGGLILALLSGTLRARGLGALLSKRFEGDESGSI